MARPARDIFVISDLHLGDGGMRDNFEAGKKTPELRAFLDHVGSEGGELFVLGDLFELWQVSLSRLFVKRRELLDHFATLPLVYVPGNHDVDLAHFVDTDFIAHPFFAHMRAPFVRELGGKTFRFFHGHEVDPFNAGDDPGFGRMLAIFAGVFEDQNGSPFLASGESAEDVLELFGDSMLTLWTSAMATIGGTHAGRKGAPEFALTPAQNPSRLAEHVTGVRAHLESCHYDVAVLGHTHQPGRIGNWYFNSGSWTGRRNSFLRVSPDGDVRYLEWKEGRPIEHDVPIVVPEAKPTRLPSAAKHPFTAPIAAVKTLFPQVKRPERSRWILVLQGTLALAVGIAAMTITISEGTSEGLRLLVTSFGLYALIDGGLTVLAASRRQPLRRLFNRLHGLASILLGLIVLRRGYVVEIFVILVGVWAFFTGVLRIAASVMFKTMVASRWLFAMGVGSVAVGLVLLFLPASAALLKFAVSGYLCYYGAGELLAGLFGRRRATTIPSSDPLPRSGPDAIRFSTSST